MNIDFNQNKWSFISLLMAGLELGTYLLERDGRRKKERKERSDGGISLKM